MLKLRWSGIRVCQFSYAPRKLVGVEISIEFDSQCPKIQTLDADDAGWVAVGSVVSFTEVPSSCDQVDLSGQQIAADSKSAQAICSARR